MRIIRPYGRSRSASTDAAEINIGYLRRPDLKSTLSLIPGASQQRWDSRCATCDR